MCAKNAWCVKNLKGDLPVQENENRKTRDKKQQCFYLCIHFNCQCNKQTPPNLENKIATVTNPE